MGNKKKPGRPARKGGQKPGRPVRIRHALIEQVEVAAERFATTPPEIVNRYVREGLERDKLWPPDAPH